MDLSKLSLIELSLEYANRYEEWASEFSAANEAQYILPNWQDFPALLTRLQSETLSEGLPEGVVPQTCFWLVDSTDRLLGETHLRHYLNPALTEEGGHIGYVIRPSERQKGYGTTILALLLPKAKSLGLRRVLVTCDTDNLASARIIEKNGGILASHAISTRSGKQISRYWIELMK
jgi:predicted acetyltransferase